MAFNADAGSVLDSLDEDWAKFQLQLPDLGPVPDGPGDEEDSKGIHGKGRGKNRRGGGKAGVTKSVAKAKAAKPIKCRGCHKKVQGDEIALNFPGCWSCKRAVDNVYKLACKQGDEARKFVSEARVDEEACYALVQNYMAKCPETTVCTGRRRGPWNLLQYIETVKASSGLLKDQVGEFMSKAVYLEFAPTARGGQKSASEAEAQWAEWMLKVQNQDPDTLFDRRGPGGSLRIWVGVKDLLIWRQQYMHEKGVSLQGESKKKATDQDVDKYRSELLSKHGAAASMGFSAVAQALAVNGEAAFSERGGFLLDVLELQPDADIAEVDTKTGAGAPAAGNDKEPSEPSPKKPKIWIDRDRLVSSTIRTVKHQYEQFKQKAEEQLIKQKEFLESFERDCDDSMKEHFKGELGTLRTRQETTNPTWPGGPTTHPKAKNPTLQNPKKQKIQHCKTQKNKKSNIAKPKKTKNPTLQNPEKQKTKTAKPNNQQNPRLQNKPKNQTI